ncbi:GerAB/ArcD/ProY family transporter [Clostridium formicaceticum]|uniref:Spore germination protein YndE n=1 Tax=Clostridium formicaceticum TaxID=1497 RepID=A0AAC9RK67_9CLOT|nr:endospore germination permease [Clostridium formicaceticum]AOY78050.1 spore gernimation protein [Clostridium formicaceticum]ARE88686.1 Spore germination protein YndE [Clostridium formicaceticum]
MYQKYKNGEISAIQSFVIILNIIVGSGILGLARSVAEVSQQDAWISVLLNGFFISFIMMIIVYTISKFPKYNFLQYTCCLLGKPLGYFIAIGYSIYAFLVTAVVIRFLSEMVYTWLLPNTPIYIINFIILITAVYMTRNGLTTLARFAEVLVFLLLPFALLIFIGLPQASLINLRPIGGSGISNILKGILPSFFAFAGYEVLLIYYPYISDKQRPIMKYAVMATLSITVLYTATVLSQIALYGPQEIAQVLYPSINYLTAVDFPVVERTEIFFAIFWTFTVLATIGIQYLAGCIVLQSIFSTKKTNFFTYIFAPIIYLLSLYPQNTAEVVEIGEQVANFNLFFGFVLPLTLFFMYFIRGRRAL